MNSSMRSAKRGAIWVGLCGPAVLLASATAISAAAPIKAPRDIPIVGERIFPESMTADAKGTVYVGSSTYGTIYRARRGAAQVTPWIVANQANGLQSVLGVFADDVHGLLWVCANPKLGQSGSSSLKSFALTSGALVASYGIPAGKPAACNDIAIAKDGTVFASETMSGRIFTLSPRAKELTLFAESDALKGVDGIAFGGDGTLYVNNVVTNLLQRVDRAADGRFKGLTTIAVDAPLNGPDGLRSIGGNRFLQAEGHSDHIELVTIDGDRAHVVTVKSGMIGPSAMTLTGSKVGYVLESKLSYLMDPALQGKDPGKFMLRGFSLKD